MFDEATASVDLATDALIQTMVREAFVDSTVITVAHRLETILDSDRIMALNDGRVEEFDTPRNLLDNPNGLLTSLVDAAGPETAAKLRAIVYRGGDVTEAIAVVQEAQAQQMEESLERQPQVQREPLLKTCLQARCARACRKARC